MHPCLAPSPVGKESAHLSPAPACAPSSPLNRFLSAIARLLLFLASPPRPPTSSTTCSTSKPTAAIRKSARVPLRPAICRPSPESSLHPLFLVLAFVGARLLPVAFFAVAAALSGHNARLLLVPQAHRPRRCAGALRPLHVAPARRQRRHGNRTSRTGSPASRSFFSSRSPSSSDLPSCRICAPAACPRSNGRGYLVTDIDQLRSFGTASAFAAVVVFAIYISSSDVIAALPPRSNCSGSSCRS